MRFNKTYNYGCIKFNSFQNSYIHLKSNPIILRIILKVDEPNIFDRISLKANVYKGNWEKMLRFILKAVLLNFLKVLKRFSASKNIWLLMYDVNQKVCTTKTLNSKFYYK